jgi:hypothetical protein
MTFDSIVTEIQAFITELGVEPDGTSYMGASPLSTMCGVSRQALLDKRSSSLGIFARILSGKNLPECLEPFAGFNYWLSGKVPDSLASAVIYYYAVEARKPSRKAKQVLQALIGKTVKDFITAACVGVVSDNSPKTLPARITHESFKNYIYSFDRPLLGAELANYFNVTVSTARDWANKLEAQGLITKIKIKSTGQVVFGYCKPGIDPDSAIDTYFPATIVEVNDLTSQTTPDVATPPSTFYKDFLEFINRYEISSSTKLKLLEVAITGA